jgi:hypothetical protein
MLLAILSAFRVYKEQAWGGFLWCRRSSRWVTRAALAPTTEPTIAW